MLDYNPDELNEERTHDMVGPDVPPPVPSVGGDSLTSAEAKFALLVKAGYRKEMIKLLHDSFKDAKSIKVFAGTLIQYFGVDSSLVSSWDRVLQATMMDSHELRQRAKTSELTRQVIYAHDFHSFFLGMTSIRKGRSADPFHLSFHVADVSYVRPSDGKVDIEQAREFCRAYGKTIKKEVVLEELPLNVEIALRTVVHLFRIVYRSDRKISLTRLFGVQNLSFPEGFPHPERFSAWVDEIEDMLTGLDWVESKETYVVTKLYKSCVHPEKLNALKMIPFSIADIDRAAGLEAALMMKDTMLQMSLTDLMKSLVTLCAGNDGLSVRLRDSRQVRGLLSLANTETKEMGCPYQGATGLGLDVTTPLAWCDALAPYARSNMVMILGDPTGPAKALQLHGCLGKIHYRNGNKPNLPGVDHDDYRIHLGGLEEYDLIISNVKWTELSLSNTYLSDRGKVRYDGELEAVHYPSLVSVVGDRPLVGSCHIHQDMTMWLPGMFNGTEGDVYHRGRRHNDFVVFRVSGKRSWTLKGQNEDGSDNLQPKLNGPFVRRLMVKICDAAAFALAINRLRDFCCLFGYRPGDVMAHVANDTKHPRTAAAYKLTAGETRMMGVIVARMVYAPPKAAPVPVPLGQAVIINRLQGLDLGDENVDSVPIDVPGPTTGTPVNVPAPAAPAEPTSARTRGAQQQKKAKVSAPPPVEPEDEEEDEVSEEEDEDYVSESSSEREKTPPPAPTLGAKKRPAPAPKKKSKEVASEDELERKGKGKKAPSKSSKKKS